MIAPSKRPDDEERLGPLEIGFLLAIAALVIWAALVVAKAIEVGP